MNTAVSLNTSILALLTAFFFAKSDNTEWYWWVALAYFVLMDELNYWIKRNI